MNKTLTTALLAAGVTAILVTISSRLTAQPAAAPAGCEESLTVFQDVSIFGRKNGAADNITERHAEMAVDGWRYADMEVLFENSDLEGFFLTYVRDAACPAG